VLPDPLPLRDGALIANCHVMKPPPAAQGAAPLSGTTDLPTTLPAFLLTEHSFLLPGRDGLVYPNVANKLAPGIAVPALGLGVLLHQP